MILLAIALQAAAVPLPPAPEPALLPVETRADGSQRWSIMSCPTRQKAGEIVVCGKRDQNDFDGPAAGRGANRDLSAANALALQATPCAARQGGCQVGVNILGPPTMLVRVIQKLVNPNSDCCEGSDATNPLSLVRDAAKGVKGAFAAKVDKSNRIPIVLDDPAPVAVPPPVDAENGVGAAKR
ncbi:hypothetical protein NF701_15000 [Sphingomonadaceae bacterium OTU29THOMA1]|nr:hypothetical protein NF701_15000 [Sphingomonadaceae bacterium OTU29THOMA1]